MRYKAEYFLGKLTNSTIVYLLLPIILQRLKQKKKKKKSIKKERKKRKFSEYSSIALFTKIGQKLPTYAQFPCFNSIKASF